VPATLRSNRPTKVEPMPTEREKGCAFLSVICPTTGCSNEAVNWNANVIMPICAKFSA
jgi:hypothetical protein